MNSEDYDVLLELWRKHGDATLRHHLDEWLESEKKGPERPQPEAPEKVRYTCADCGLSTTDVGEATRHQSETGHSKFKVDQV